MSGKVDQDYEYVYIPSQLIHPIIAGNILSYDS